MNVQQHQPPGDGRSNSSASAVQRVFLDWTAPLLPQAAQWLLDCAGPAESDALPHCVDLRAVMCVLPGRRAGRLLLDELTRRSRQSDRALLPPTITTPGAAVDLLLDDASDRALADQFTSELAWLTALREAPAEVLSRIVAAPPPAEDWPTWYDLAATISRVHETIAGARQTFEAVADAAMRRELMQEGDRWQAMHDVHQQYQSVLDRLGWLDAHDQREQALRAGHLSGEYTQVVLIGVVDLNLLQRAVVQRAAESPTAVTAMVHAPDERADAFDALGCVAADHWRDVVIDDDFTLNACDRPSDQAQRIIETIADADGAYAADQITIGLGDETLAGPIERGARWAGLSMHHATGRPLARTAPFRLLAVLAEWLAESRFAHFAALVRHPHVERWLRRQLADDDTIDRAVHDWMTLLDTYFDAHLQQTIGEHWLGDMNKQRGLKLVFDRVNALLEPMAATTRPLSGWSMPIIDVLRAIYEAPSDDDDREHRLPPATERACEVLRDAALELSGADVALQPQVNASTALRLLLMRCGQQPVAANPRDDQIEMLGWLELHADPAPLLIVAGVNEGAIPSSAGADLFLPDGLRRELGMPNNDTRYARDAYYMTAIPKSRRHVTMLTGRRAANDEPLTPSRLLLTGDDDTLLRRAAELCSESELTDVTIPVGLRAPAAETRFDVPGLPEAIEPPSYMRITDFRMYLSCPFRYALARLLNLQRVIDDATELNPMHFGNLLHRTLQMFGSDAALRDSADADRIERELTGMLDDLARADYGSAPMPSVRIQLSAARRRLRGFAKRQAELRAEGWEIVHVEHNINRDVSLDVPDDAPMPLAGRIDRIDVHAASRTMRVIDYKTGERDDSPIAAHHGKTRRPRLDECEWCDLQLPLYDYIVRRAAMVDDIDAVELGYFVLPKDSRKVDFLKADWTPEYLDHAVQTAQDIVRRIRSGQFERNRDIDARYDDFARLCHSQFFANFVGDDDEDEVPE